jgi:hypothetical protein
MLDGNKKIVLKGDEGENDAFKYELIVINKTEYDELNESISAIEGVLYKKENRNEDGSPNDVNQILLDNFRIKYGLNYHEVYSIGDTNLKPVDIKPLIPSIKSHRHCNSLTEAMKPVNEITLYRAYVWKDWRTHHNNPATIGIKAHEDIMSAWNGLMWMLKNPQYCLIIRVKNENS